MKKFRACKRAYGNVNFPVFDVREIFLNSEGDSTFQFVDVDGIGIDSGNA